MEFKKLINGTPVWYNKELDSEKEIVAATFEASGDKYVALVGSEEEPWDFDYFKTIYSLTKEDAIKKCAERAVQTKELIKNIYGMEIKLKQMTQKLSNDFDERYITIDELNGEKENQRFKDSLKRMCKMINVPMEFFDYYTHDYHLESMEKRRRKVLAIIDVYEKE